ncbi:hypothetical protein PssiTeo3_11730 [Pseudomonas sichuanensis]|nr:hypothetical protein [Pseudomonas sichuanensis]
MGQLVEQLPGTEKIHAGAEAGLADHQAGVWRQFGEALTQAVLLDEHMHGFVDAFFPGEIHIVVLARVGAALVVPVDLGMQGEG